MNTLKLDEMKRQALAAGRGEMVSVDAEDLLELLAEVRVGFDEQDLQSAWIGGYEYGWEECAECIDPICSPNRAERAWNRLKT